MTYSLKLDRIKGRSFGYGEVLAQNPGMDYKALYDLLEELCAAGVIEPVKSSKKTSFVPQVYNKYRKAAVSEDYSALLPEIRALHPSLNIERYLKNPGKFQAVRQEVNRLSDLLWRDAKCIHQWMSVKEKSYAIWGDEKYLESSGGGEILQFNGLDANRLHYYYAPEPFFARIVAPESTGNVLILENKDPWYSIGRAMGAEKKGSIAGISIGMLVYGEGRKITRAQDSLTSFLENMGYPGDGGKVYYAGDIDRAGIAIFYGLKKSNPQLDAVPCLPLYNTMILRAITQEIKLRPSEDQRDISWNHDFLDFFEPEYGAFIQQVLDENQCIPQECMHLQDYMAMVHRTEDRNV